MQQYRKTQKAIPDGITHLRPIDAELAERFPQYHSVIDPHSKRFGYCLMDRENIVSECNAIYVVVAKQK
ncbi:MAG: hypothetical protein R3E31_09025 [Chloroflexota bacterium]